MGYTIEVRLASKNGWHTPAEARSYYGRYSREGITWHWWGDGTGASNHDNIVNYMLSGATKGQKSVNYVLSDLKISNLVEWRNVAWTSQSGNPVTVSVELQPTLNAEGYKKAGWLKYTLVGQGLGRKNYPHNFWYPTQCPGTISLDRIEQEFIKWSNGGYNPVPPTPPAPPANKPADLEWVRWKEGAIQYVANKQPTKLWNFDQTSWAGFGNGVKDFNKGDQVLIVGEVNNKTLNAKYLLTAYSFDKKITHGFNAADLSVFVPPTPTVPTPPPLPPPELPPAYKPEWVANLHDIDDTDYWIKKDTYLIDITTGQPAKNAAGATTLLKKDEKFRISALTKSNNVEYRITDYSFKKGVFNGVPISELTLTEPGVPNVPPVPNFEVRLTALEKLLEKVVELLRNLKFWKD